MGALNVLALTFLYQDREYTVDAVDRDQVRVADTLYAVRRDDDGMVRVEKQRAWVATDGDVRWVFLDGRVFELSEPQPKSRRRRAAADAALAAPMPATVRRILVAAGDAVERGDTLLLLEAMKMELPIRAAAPGTVKAVNCREGELVQAGVPLIEIAPRT